MTNKKNGEVELISKRAVKVAINNAFNDAFNGYFLQSDKSIEENIKYNTGRIRERLKRLYKSVNRMPVIASAEYLSKFLKEKK